VDLSAARSFGNPIQGFCHCPKCTTRMITTAASLGPMGFESRAFECLKYGHTEEKVLASDPLKSNAIGWLAGELGKAQVRAS
jgi:hypothetical protein